jgi:hypothetical protein
MDASRRSNTSVDPDSKLRYKDKKTIPRDSEVGQPLLIGEKSRYNFSFSKYEQLAGRRSICRILTIILLVIASLFLPTAVLINNNLSSVYWDIPWWAWLIYVIVVNTTILMIFGAYIVSTLAYPYSNSILVRRLRV